MSLRPRVSRSLPRSLRPAIASSAASVLASARRCSTLLLCGAAAWAAAPPTAAADEPQVHLAWERPLGSTCPPASVLEHDVETTLDRPVFTSLPDAQLVIRGFIEENDAGGTWVRLTARHRDGTLLGTRELRAPGGGCAALRSDIVLVLTLLVEREHVSNAASAAVSVHVGAAGSALLNVMPRWAAGAGPTLVVDIADSLQLRADLAYFLSVTVRTQSGIQASLRAVSLTLRACLPLLAADANPWSLHACAGVAAGTWLISQSEPDRRELQVRLLAQGLAELRAGVRLGDGVKLELGAGPTFTIHRASLYAAYDNNARELLYRVPLLGAQVQLGLTF